jgi:hypothetical protein
MGDFRFSFKATFEMGSIKDTCDMWLNWSPDEGGDTYPVDKRAIEWLRVNFEKGVEDIREAMRQSDTEGRSRERREEEDRILAQADEIRAQRSKDIARAIAEGEG